MFNMSNSDLKKLKRFMKESPREFKIASSGTLNSLAFKTREYDIENLTRSMIIRNPRFLKSGIRIEKSRPSTQMSSVFSINRGSHTGWKEQEDGGYMDRTNTLSARGGSKTKVMLRRARLRPGNKIYKPSDYKLKSYMSSYMFMMRMINNSGGGEFLLSRQTGKLSPGLYSVRKEKVSKLQDFDRARVKRTNWRTSSLRSLVVRNDISKMWRENIKRVLERGMKK